MMAGVSSHTRPIAMLAAALAALAVAGCSSPEPAPAPLPPEAIDVAAWRDDLAAAGVTSRQTGPELLAFGRRACASPDDTLVSSYLVLSGEPAAQTGLYLAVRHTCPDRADELEAYRTT